MSSQSSPGRTVHKFGGAALADGARLRRVGAILRERVADRPVAVVSAVFGVTSMLDALARDAAAGSFDLAPIRVRHRGLLAQLGLDAELGNRHLTELAAVLGGIRRCGRVGASERDHVLSFGERISARIVAAHLNHAGVRAVPIDAFDLGLVSDSNHGRASILSDSAVRVRAALESLDGVPVITGFVAADARGNLTTLGRNGSDLSAALIGEAIGASEVVFWKDVEGVLSADPKLVPSARIVRELSYDEAAEFTRHGASVLHPDAVTPLQRAQLCARVACVRDPSDAGTRIQGEAREPRNLGVACRHGLARYVVHGEVDERAVLDAVQHAGAEPLRVAAHESSITVVAPWNDELALALPALGRRVELERELATVAAVGNAFEPARVREALSLAGIVVHDEWRMGERGTHVFVVAELDLARAAAAVHAALFDTTTVAGNR